MHDLILLLSVFTLKSSPHRNSHIKKQHSECLKKCVHTVLPPFFSLLLTTAPSFCPQDLISLMRLSTSFPRFQQFPPEFQPLRSSKKPTWCLLLTSWIQNYLECPMFCTYCVGLSEKHAALCPFPLWFCFPPTHCCTRLVSQGLLKISLSHKKKDLFSRSNSRIEVQNSTRPHGLHYWVKWGRQSSVIDMLCRSWQQ